MSDRILQSLLLSHHLVTAEQLQEAMALSKSSGPTWLEELVLASELPEEDLVNCVSRSLWFPRCDFSMLTQIPRHVLARIPVAIAVANRLLPIRVDQDGDLHVAMVDPTDSETLEEIEFFAGTHFVREVAPPSSIAWALHHYYGVSTALWPRAAAESSFRVEPAQAGMGG